MKLLTHARTIVYEIAAADFILCFAVLMISRWLLPGSFPRWFWLALSSFVWAGTGIFTHKFEFWYYDNRKKALWTIILVDIAVYSLSFAAWKMLFPERDILAAQLWPLPILAVIECSLYLLWRYLFKKVQYLCVDIIEQPFQERGIEKAVHYLDNTQLSEDLSLIYKATRNLDEAGYCRWITAHRHELSADTLVVDTGDVSQLEECVRQLGDRPTGDVSQLEECVRQLGDRPTGDVSQLEECVRQLGDRPTGDVSQHKDCVSQLEECNRQLEERDIRPKLIICLQPFNNIRHFNAFLAKANGLLADGGTIAIHGETSSLRRHRITSAYPNGIGRVVEIADYIWSRVIPKLALTRKTYMLITGGRSRNYPRVEVLGRIARAGFEIRGDEIRNGAFYVSAVRTKAPATGKPNYGVIIRLPRKGKNGKNIGVFKLRTMYAYSEYIQDYTYKLNGLEKGGKLKDDFRVNFLGAFCRSRFLDELPMLINFFKRDLKLVGVRPLSKHYLSLYTPEMQKMHLSVKPGVFPPLYYEYPKPDTIEEIQESERRYIELYNKRPHHTDWVYFWGMMKNIFFRRERSH